MAKEYVKNYLNQIKEIKEKLVEIDSVVANLPASSWKTSIETSQKNFHVKVDAFLDVSAELSPEQKAAIAAIKTGKATKEQISALSAVMEKPVESSAANEASAGSNDEKPTTSTKSIKGKRK